MVIVISLFLYGVLLAFLFLQIKYTRGSMFVVFFWWTMGSALLAILERFSRDRSLLQDIPWEPISNFYFLLGLFLFFLFLFRMVWPHPLLREHQLFERALELEAQKNHVNALRVAKQLLARSPGSPKTRYLMGKVLNEQGRFHEALPHLEFAHGLDPNSVSILLELGTSYIRLQRYQEAFVTFEKTLALRPEDTYAVEQIAICQQKLKHLSTKQ